MDGFNANIENEQIRKLKELFPETVVEGKVDFDKLRLILGDDIELGQRYGLNWKGKSNVFAKIQEKTVSTLHPQPEESIDWDTTQNMFIEGDNFETLKALHKAYYGKIKMIYIDPPYNTGNDFVYNDNFRKTLRDHAIDEETINEEGNILRDDGLRVNSGGHKHSNWLDMMYPRLFLARNLMSQDGVIFVSIDDNEAHNLRLMMNEIFGEENFLAENVVVVNPGGRKYGSFSKSLDRLLVYARNVDFVDTNEVSGEGADFQYQDEKGGFNYHELLNRNIRVFNSTNRPNLRYPFYVNLDKPDHNGFYPVSLTRLEGWTEVWGREKDGLKAVWTWGKERAAKHIDELFATRNNQDGSIQIQRKLRKYTTLPNTLWPSAPDIAKSRRAAVYSSFSASQEVQKLFNGKMFFDFPKPTALIKRIAEIGTDSDSIVLDFFSGSGTTADAIMQLNTEDEGTRRWIMVQLPELTDENSEAYKAGYKTIPQIARERIQRAGEKVRKDYAEKIAERKAPLDLGFRSYTLGDSNFKKWNELVTDPDELKQQTLNHLNPIEDNAKDQDLLTEVLLKRGISPLAEVKTYDGFVFVPSEFLVISLSRNMSEELFTKILATKPSQIILLDQAFNGDVNLKTNLILQAEKQNIVVEVL